MKCKFTVEFESEKQLLEWLANKAPLAAEDTPIPYSVVKPDPAPKAEPEAEEPVEPKRKPGRPPKAEPVVSAADPTKEEPKADDKAREKARLIVVGKIRGFVLADKVTNMKKLIAAMPAGKKAIDQLTLEEAQTIALEMGIE